MTPTLERALLAHREGRTAAAEQAYAEHLAANPQEPNGLHMLGVLRLQQGRKEEAATLILRALEHGASGASVHVNLAAVRLAQGDLPAALAASRRAVEVDPEHLGAWLNLGLAAEAAHDDALAADALQRVLARRPDEEKALAALARVQAHGGEHGAALATLARRAALRPADADAQFRHARALLEGGRLSAAIGRLREVVQMPGASVDARLLLASALLDRGEPEESIAQSELLLAARPDYHQAHSNYLIALQHVPGVGPQRLYDAHVEWARLHALESRPGAAPTKLPAVVGAAHGRDSKTQIVLGFVSPRFHEGPVATFLTPLLEHIDRERHRIVLYAGSRHADAATERLLELGDDWCDAYRLDDDALCARIAADRVDVLFDLSGHAPANRLRVFARRPAPVQVAWLDYFCTTGLAAIDWYYSDPVLTPEGSPQRFAERVLRLARGRLCYSPPAGAPPVSPRAAGPLRFASFNRLAKLNDEVIASWSAILRAVPGSILRLRGSAYDDPDTREWLLTARFAPHGIARERIELHGFGTHADTMAAYADVDVALDPFPFSGCATSCDALWMGVPVVTLARDTLVSRQSASLLHAVGLGELATLSLDDYVATAVRLARDEALRATLRRELRERAQAGFADATAFARAFEDAVAACLRETPGGGTRA